MFGDTPLHYAARERNLVVVKALLAKKADVNCQNKNGETPIFLAAGRTGCENEKRQIDIGLCRRRYAETAGKPVRFSPLSK